MGKWYRNTSAIYMITNVISGKIYIGSAVNYMRRFIQHKFELRSNTHDNTHLLRSWNKYGEDSFLFNVLELVNDKTKLIEREQFWMDLLKPEYNIRKNAISNLGCRWKLSEEENLAKSLRMKNKTFSKEHKINLSISSLNKPKSEKHKINLSLSRKGKPWTEARRLAQINKNK